MKTLFVLRHAKSSRDNPQLKDFARPLTASGLADTKLIGSRLRESGVEINAIVSSPAERTRQTADLFAQHLGLPAESVSCSAELYFAGAPMLRQAVSRFDDSHSVAMLVGHNPAVTDFVNELGALEIENVPTCGLLKFEVTIQKWQEIGEAQAKLVDFDYPKREPIESPKP